MDVRGELYQLYRNYMHELWVYTGAYYEDRLHSWFTDLLEECCVRLIWRGGKLVGFLMIQTIDDTSGYRIGVYKAKYIAEAYVLPEYRGQGLMTKALDDFFFDTVCLYVIKRNKNAKKFWLSYFRDYKLRYSVRDLPGFEHDNKCDLLIFER